MFWRKRKTSIGHNVELVIDVDSLIDHKNHIIIRSLSFRDNDIVNSIGMVNKPLPIKTHRELVEKLKLLPNIDDLHPRFNDYWKNHVKKYAKRITDRPTTGLMLTNIGYAGYSGLLDEFIDFRLTYNKCFYGRSGN